MKDNTDPLAALISDDVKAIDRQKLAEILAPYLVIDQNSQDFGFKSPFQELQGNEVKVEILLAGAKARSLLFGTQDGMTPTEIMAAGVMAEGSVKSSLKRLSDSSKIKKGKDGRYVLPAHRISELGKRITN